MFPGSLLPLVAVFNLSVKSLLKKADIMRMVFSCPNLKGLTISTVASDSCGLVRKCML